MHLTDWVISMDQGRGTEMLIGGDKKMTGLRYILFIMGRADESNSSTPLKR
jgi:hypothetical protein